MTSEREGDRAGRTEHRRGEIDQTEGGVGSPEGPEGFAQRLQRSLSAVRNGNVDRRRAAARRAGDSVRMVIERLISTEVPAEVLDAAAARMSEIADLLDVEGTVRRYEGMAEEPGLGFDPTFFDWSPVLGLANPLSPPLYVDIEKDVVVGRGRFGDAYEGPPGCVHGGFVAAAFDEVLGVTQSLSGQLGMTGTLTVHYRRPTPLHCDLRFEGRVDQVSGRKVLTSARLYAGEELTAEASGVFVSVPAGLFEGSRRGRSK